MCFAEQTVFCYCKTWDYTLNYKGNYGLVVLWTDSSARVVVQQHDLRYDLTLTVITVSLCPAGPPGNACACFIILHQRKSTHLVVLMKEPNTVGGKSCCKHVTIKCLFNYEGYKLLLIW